MIEMDDKRNQVFIIYLDRNEDDDDRTECMK